MERRGGQKNKTNRRISEGDLSLSVWHGGVRPRPNHAQCVDTAEFHSCKIRGKKSWACPPPPPPLDASRSDRRGNEQLGQRQKCASIAVPARVVTPTHTHFSPHRQVQEYSKIRTFLHPLALLHSFKCSFNLFLSTYAKLGSVMPLPLLPTPFPQARFNFRACLSCG